MSDLLVGRVVRVCGDTEVIINLGADAGVEKGMKFKIMSEDIEVTDTDGSSLGGMVLTKGIVVVTGVLPKFSLAETEKRFMSKQVVKKPATQLPLTLAALLTPARSDKYTTESYLEQDKLRVDPVYVQSLDKSRTVMVGDRVILASPPRRPVAPPTTNEHVPAKEPAEEAEGKTTAQ